MGNFIRVGDPCMMLPLVHGLKTPEAKLNDLISQCGFHCLVQVKSVHKKEETYVSLRHNVNIDDNCVFLCGFECYEYTNGDI